MRARLYRINLYWLVIGVVFGLGWQWRDRQ